MSDIKDQPPPTPSAGPDIADLVREDLAERKAVGVERYGTPLRAHNGRDALIDAYQEVLDLTCYLRQEIAERHDCAEIVQELVATRNQRDGLAGACLAVVRFFGGLQLDPEDTDHLALREAAEQCRGALDDAGLLPADEPQPALPRVDEPQEAAPAIDLLESLKKAMTKTQQGHGRRTASIEPSGPSGLAASSDVVKQRGEDGPHIDAATESEAVQAVSPPSSSPADLDSTSDGAP